MFEVSRVGRNSNFKAIDFYRKQFVTYVVMRLRVRSSLLRLDPIVQTLRVSQWVLFGDRAGVSEAKLPSIICVQITCKYQVSPSLSCTIELVK